MSTDANSLGWLLLTIVFKSTLLLAVPLAGCFLFRRVSAARRHLVWSCAIVAAILLPILCVVLPSWPIGVLPSPITQVAASSVAAVPTSSPVKPKANAETSIPPEQRSSPPKSTPVAATGIDQAQPPAAVNPTASNNYDVNPLSIVTGIWLLGTLCVLLQLVAGLREAQRSLSLSKPADSRVQRIGEAVLAAIALKRKVEIRQSMMIGVVQVPITWGIRHPVVLLPVDAAKWSDESLRTTLLHEMTHVKRFDWIIQMSALIACALYWFNPFIWIAAGKLKAESELACDDAVLAAGVAPTSYAQSLVDVVRSVKRVTTMSRVVVGIASSSDIAGRVSALLNERTNRNGVRRYRYFETAMALCAVLIPLSAIRLSAEPVTLFIDNGGDGSTMQSPDGWTVPVGYVLKPHPTGNIVFFIMPQASLGQDKRYQITENGESISLFDRQDNQTFHDDSQIAADLSKMLVLGTGERQGTQLHQFPDSLSFALAGKPSSAWLDPDQTATALDLSNQANEWNTFMSTCLYVLDDSDITSASEAVTPTDGPCINITLSAHGQSEMSAMSSKYLHCIMGVFENHTLSLAATIVEPIQGNSLQIDNVAKTPSPQWTSIISSLPDHVYQLESADPSLARPASVSAGVTPLVVPSGGRATLPNGYTIRVEGISRAIAEAWNWEWNQDAIPMWDVSGNRLRHAYAGRWSDWSRGEGSVLEDRGNAPYDIWVSFSPPNRRLAGAVTEVSAIPGVIVHGADPSYERGESPSTGSSDEDVVTFPNGTKSCTVVAGVGDGPWTTVASHDVDFSPSKNIPLFPDSSPIDVLIDTESQTISYAENSGKTSTVHFNPGPLDLSDNLGRRAVAVDDQGHLIPLVPDGRDDVSLSFDTTPGSYPYRENPAVSLAHIKKILLQTRPCEIVKLQNIPLQPH